MNNFAIETLLIILLVLFIGLIVTQLWLWLRPFIYDLRLPIELKQNIRALMQPLGQVSPRGVIEKQYGAQFELISLRKTAMPEKLQLVKSLFEQASQNGDDHTHEPEREIIEYCIHQYQDLLNVAPLTSRTFCYSNTGYFLCASGVWLCQILLAKQEDDSVSE